MNLCACESEEREHGVGAGVNATVLSRNTIGLLKVRKEKTFFYFFIYSPFYACEEVSNMLYLVCQLCLTDHFLVLICPNS